MKNFASFRNVSDRNNRFHEVNANDETRGKIPDEVSDIPFAGTHFDRGSDSHQIYVINNIENCF